MFHACFQKFNVAENFFLGTKHALNSTSAAPAHPYTSVHLRFHPQTPFSSRRDSRAPPPVFNCAAEDVRPERVRAPLPTPLQPQPLGGEPPPPAAALESAAGTPLRSWKWPRWPCHREQRSGRPRACPHAGISPLPLLRNHARDAIGALEQRRRQSRTAGPALPHEPESPRCHRPSPDRSKFPPSPAMHWMNNLW